MSERHLHRRILVFAILSIAGCGLAASSDAADFNRQIRPLLSRACFPCHGPDEDSRHGNLRLDTQAGALRTEDPVIVPGSAETSLLIKRITSADPQTRMPPPDARQQLTDHEIEVLRQWIDDGVPWNEHWSFRPLQRPLPPQVPHPEWSRDGIDDFILDSLFRRGVTPSAEAVKSTLLRRVSLDLVGLPPTLIEQSEFDRDERPDAFERLVDRLLTSPHFGERWGRHWLDVARYADSGGFEGDPPRTVWKYRDWVLNALNGDLPFDQFVVRQLAGDLFPEASAQDRLATGFLLNSQQDGGSEAARLDAVFDRVNTIGTVFLGLTIGCAQCHSHKFDPLSHREYYALFAFVNGADETKLEFASSEQLSRRDALAAQIASLRSERTTYADTVPAEKLKSDPGYLERSATIEMLTSRLPNFESALVLQPASVDRVTTTFLRGEFARPGETVTPDVPGVLPPLPEGKRTRIELARWLVTPSHPLTPRVTVNRVWQQLFGRGIVETENDFGSQGAGPSHPELLDELASDFSQRGWRFKALIRRIVTSAVYRQSSQRRFDLERTDPENRWLARQSRLRLEAEIVRDVALSASGLLSTKVGGPGVFPFQHDGIMNNRATPAPWIVSPGEDRYRRGLYTYYWRLTPHPQLQTFDAPDAITACTRRPTSNTPLQALALLNDPTFTEAADELARQLVALPINGSEQAADTERIHRAVQISLGRFPSEDECDVLRQLLTTSRFSFDSANSAGGALKQVRERAVWTQLTRTLINLEEFIVRE